VPTAPSEAPAPWERPGLRRAGIQRQSPAREPGQRRRRRRLDFADLAPHGVCGREVNQVAGPGGLSLLIFGTYLA